MLRLKINTLLSKVTFSWLKAKQCCGSKSILCLAPIQQITWSQGSSAWTSQLLFTRISTGLAFSGGMTVQWAKSQEWEDGCDQNVLGAAWLLRISENWEEDCSEQQCKHWLQWPLPGHGQPPCQGGRLPGDQEDQEDCGLTSVCRWLTPLWVGTWGPSPTPSKYCPYSVAPRQSADLIRIIRTGLSQLINQQ